MFLLLFFALFLPFIDCTCPEKSVEWNSNCYSFISNSTGFADAEVSCNKIGGSLVSIHEGFANVFIAQEAAKHFHESTESSFWIGVNSLVSRGAWNWTDGSLLNFSNWKSGEPQNITGTSCGSLSLEDGFWKAEDCFKAKPFVCAVPSTPSYPISVNCSSGWTYIAATHSCYGVAWPGLVSTWSAAETHCQSFGAHLSSIHSNVELQHLASYLYVMGANVWTGIYSPDSGRTWKASDDTEADFQKYANWCGDRPDLSAVGQRCVTLSCCSCYYDLDCTTLPSTPQRALCKKPIF